MPSGKEEKTELFPWDFIKGNTSKDRLYKRLQSALARLG